MRIRTGGGTKEFLDVCLNHHRCHVQPEVVLWGPGPFTGVLVVDNNCGSLFLFKRDVSQKKFGFCLEGISQAARFRVLSRIRTWDGLTIPYADCIYFLTFIFLHVVSDLGL